MRLFSSDDAPRVFALPPGVDFAGCFAKGLIDRLPTQAPEALARVTVAVNTRRTIRSLTDAFEARGDAVFLPRIQNIDELGANGAASPPALGRMPRLLALARMIGAFLAARPGVGAPSDANATALAQSLAALLDECQRERIPEARLATAAADERHAAHWAEFGAFFAHIAATWPEILRTDFGAVEPETRRAAETDALLASWAERPPEAPLIAAGSTGSRRLTADLLVAIARAPGGAVVLPGFDFALDRDAWAETRPDHPQHRFRVLLDRLQMTPTDVRPWLEDAATPSRARAALFSQALRPAPVTHHWRASRRDLQPMIAEAVSGLSVLEAPSPRWEADAIAHAIRAELGRADATVALISPDRTLARRVAAALRRWGVEPDDSSGQPLALSPPGVFLALTAEALSRGFDPVALMAALKHPLCAEDARREHRRALDRLEKEGLRNRDVALRLGDMDALLGATDEDGDPVAAGDLRARLDALRPWAAPAPLPDLIARHRAAATSLAGDALWDKRAGAAAERAMDAFAEAAAIGGEVAPADYPAFLRLALEEAGDVREDAFVPDQRVKILGPLEARAQSADLMILAGLNEGVWPAAPPIDPWLSRPMREALGLPAPEQRVGLAAHDFQQAASAPRAILSRSLRDGDAPTVESRWLTRLRTLLAGAAADGAATWSAMTARGAAHLIAARALDEPGAKPQGASRPEPRPPVAARPRRISVTEVEKLIRDPYEIYARRVLRLRPLEPLAAGPDARLRGEVLHKVMEDFTRAVIADPNAPFDEAFDEAAASAIAASGAPPAEATIWRARLQRVRHWFLAEEVKRQDAGAPLDVEVAGETTLQTVVGDVVLRGRADRIDRLTDGSLAIFDYKAGSSPSQKQVEVFAKQLPIMGAMAAAGAFRGVAPAEASRLAYLTLSGAGEGGATREIEPDADALKGLTILLNHFFAPQTPYLPRAYVEKTQGYAGDYQHLSRFGEWADRAPEDAPGGGA
ncbi:MAG: PD-(D/E)XK nuclease family protein [Pseudomonadota bacterium]